MMDIAWTAGVSQATVSYVLNGRAEEESISPKMQKRIWAEARRLGYAPHAGARALKLSKTNTLCVLSGVRGLDEAVLEVNVTQSLLATCLLAADKGYRVLVEIVPPEAQDPEALQRLQTLIQSRQCDGLILGGPTRNDPRLRLLRQFRFPTVTIGRVSAKDIDFVDSDNVGIGYDATRHLLDAGCRRIAIVTGPSEHIYMQERVKGYRKALRASGIKSATGLEVMVPDLWRMDKDDQHVEAALAQLWSLNPPPDAIFASIDDVLASAILRRLRARRIRVPTDVLLIGVNNSLLSQQVHPALSTVDLHFADIGRSAAEFLIERLAEPEQPRRQAIIPHTLIARKSTRH